jgi:hypothetical protein
MSLAEEDVKYLIARLERVVELLKAGETHMAMAKLLADIAALKSGPGN